MKLAIVVPRYGDGVIGGAESVARRVASVLAEWHAVTVLTTTASDYQTWRNDLPAGVSDDGAVRVVRFAVRDARHPSWSALDRLLQRGLPPVEFATLSRARKRVLQRRLRGWPLALQEDYVRWQGPCAPELFTWLERYGAEQQRVLFFTYLYPTTYFGMERVRRKQIDLFPALHDEAVAYLPVFGECFRRADRVLFHTRHEAHVAQRLYGPVPATPHVVGCGIEEPHGAAGETPPADPCLLYVGRLDVNKGVPTLLRDFVRWKQEEPRSRLRLVLVGDRHVDVPEHPAIEYRGRVAEAEKGELMRQAVALVHPSPYESLGLALLEAFWCGTPGLVFAGNQVLVEHCRAANGGLWYRDYAELAAALSWIEGHPTEAAELGAQARDYVRREYNLDAYRARLAAVYPP